MKLLLFFYSINNNLSIVVLTQNNLWLKIPTSNKANNVYKKEYLKI